MATTPPKISGKGTLAAPGQSPRLLDQVRDRIRVLHYSIRTEAVYTDWIKRYIRHFGKCHPRELSAEHIEAFLSDLAVRGNISASTQNQNLTGRIRLFFTRLRHLQTINLPLHSREHA